MRSSILLVLVLGASTSTKAALPEARPESLGLDGAKLARIGEVIASAIEKGEVPGAVVLVGRRGKIAYAKAIGRRAIVPDAEDMTRDTRFDLASLTKPVATATSVMMLAEAAKLRLDEPFTRYLPEFDNHGKGVITIEQLLRHRSGLVADNPIDDYADGPDRAWERLANLELVAEPGTRFLYSDVNFMILGKLVERVSGAPLDVFAREQTFTPLGMESTFRPESPMRIAPTEPAAGTMLRGVVHDPRARALGGVAGHAGLFGTADDLALFAQMILNSGRGSDGRRILSRASVLAMTDPGTTPAGQRRGLGWDMDTPFSAPRGSLFGRRSFGHTGFTGTSLWIDPESEMFVILLSSRLHPDGKAPAPTALRRAIATIAADARTDVPAATTRSVSCGIDVLVRRDFAPLKGKRVGLVTNHTGVTRDGTSTIDVLFRAPEVRLVALFSPEHGIRGAVDAEVADTRDERTGLPVYSLYGKTRSPTSESLEGIDVLVYDIQDIGARFYTYISTLGLVLEAAKGRAIPLVVLDRPNPIGGTAVSGPVRDDDFESFIAWFALPVRHGMTVGELARLFNGERKIGANLAVMPCEGWRRSDLYDQTGLLWINPSPNMRSLTEALLYPGIGLLEASNLATGRGTDTPFERLGAPWIDPRALAEELNAREIPGTRFVPIRFTPRERQYAGVECGGIQIFLTDWTGFEPLTLGMEIAVALRKLYPRDWKAEGFLKMVADRATYQALLEGRNAQVISALWKGELEAFLVLRRRYLLYD